eukprot:scaffold25474_cov87-Phaeocystis_antarctica.AAC.3
MQEAAEEEEAQLRKLARKQAKRERRREEKAKVKSEIVEGAGHPTIAPCDILLRLREAPTARLDSQGCQVDGHLRLRVEGAGRYSSNSLPQLPAVERLPRAKNEV